MLSVIIPTRNIELLKLLLRSMKINTIYPDKVTILDNTDDGLSGIEDNWYDGRTLISILRCKDMSVNHMWNIGIKRCAGRSNHDIICILNDDVILSRFYFEAASLLLNSHDNVSTFIPRTCTDSPDMIQNDSTKNWGHSVPVTKRQGWAMVFKGKLLKSISPIPHERIPTFCGDDWFWYWTYKKGYSWVSSSEYLAYHKVSSTVVPMGYMKKLRKEKNEFTKIINEIEAKMEDV